MFELINKREEGNALVLIALALVTILGFSALAIDIGVMLTARTQLQDAVDAAALAGASGLLFSQAEATNRAIALAGLNDCINQPVVINAANVTFPTAGRVQVQASRLLNLFFARVLGINTANITATAAAELRTFSGSDGQKPLAVPDLGYVLGQQVVLKSGTSGTPPSFYNAVDYPPVNKGNPVSGANEYRENLINGSTMAIEIGDILQVEPGNMVGPTKQAVDNLISQDPNAYWDGTKGQVVHSNYPGYSSPRIIKIPMYDPNYPPKSGRSTITVVRLGAFFLEGMQGKDVVGRFMKITTSGIWGPGPSMLYGMKLVQ